MFEKMVINSDDSELLIAFEEGKTIEKTARIIGKDPSGVSRQLLRISKSCLALEKRNGKWALTDTGKRLNSATKEFIRFQKQLVKTKIVLRIGTNREFGSRILGNHMSKLSSMLPNTHLAISTFEAGTEAALLEGRIDFGFDCERPYDPNIGFKHLISDPVIAVSSPNFKKQHLKDIKSKKYGNLPHLLCDRLFPHRLSQNIEHVTAAYSFNDIATTRSACIDSCGWALLPKYSVKEEIKNKALIEIDEKPWVTTKYGIWWNRERPPNPRTLKVLSNWLKTLQL